MYLCICRNITEKQLQDKAAKASSTAEALRSLGIGSDCGTCYQKAQEMLAQIFPASARQSSQNRNRKGK